MTSALPFDDFRSLMRHMLEASSFASGRVRERLGQVGSAAEGLGRVAEISEWLACWTNRPPAVNRPLIALFAGNHGIADDGLAGRSVSQTAAFVEHCAAGGAAVSQICGSHDLGLKVFDLALDVPTQSFVSEPAFDERGCAATMAFGMEGVAGGFDLIALGGFGVGGDISAAAVVTALNGGAAREWIIEPDAQLAAKQAETIDNALKFHGAGNLRDPFEVLRRLGGREIAAIVGAILAARTEQIPVILDGYAALTAAVVLHSLNPESVGHCAVASTSDFDAVNRLIEQLGKRPILDWKLSQIGVAGAMAALSVQSAAQVFAGVKALPDA